MANITHQITRQYRNQSSNAISLTETPTGNAEVNFSASVPIAANTQYVLAFTRANLQSIVLNSANAVTVYTNNPSGSSPTDTIPLTAGQTLCWTLAGDGISKCPFSANVTTIYITNASGSASLVQISGLVNQ